MQSVWLSSSCPDGEIEEKRTKKAQREGQKEVTKAKRKEGHVDETLYRDLQ